MEQLWIKSNKAVVLMLQGPYSNISLSLSETAEAPGINGTMLIRQSILGLGYVDCIEITWQ